MPYIPQQNRKGAETSPLSPGELNFAITKLVLDYYQYLIPNYQHINDVLGAIEGAKLEFYRRVVAPYEDLKIKENGDVYP